MTHPSPFSLLDLPAPRESSIRLRPMLDSDWPAVWEFCRPFWSRLSNDFSPQTFAEFLEMKRQQIAAGWQSRGVWRYGELGGLLELEPVSPVVAQVHVCFKKSFWGRQTTIPAVEMAMEEAWAMGFKKLWCVIYPTNHLVIGLIKSLGGVYEGKLICHTQQDGVLKDYASYAILAPEVHSRR